MYDVNCRYLFALQVKRDLLTGALACQQHTAILLASYIVQGTCSVSFRSARLHTRDLLPPMLPYKTFGELDISAPVPKCL